MFSAPNVTGSMFSGSFGQDIENIAVYALENAVDVEYVVVNG